MHLTNAKLTARMMPIWPRVCTIGWVGSGCALWVWLVALPVVKRVVLGVVGWHGHKVRPFC